MFKFSSLYKMVFSVLCSVLLMAGIGIANPQEVYASNVGVVVIASSDYKDDHFFSILDKELQQVSGHNVVSGNVMQTKYQDYWLDNGFLEEQQPSPQAFVDFVNYSGYDKVLFIVMKDPVVDKNTVSGWLGRTIQTRTRATVETKGFLVDKERIVKHFTSTNEDDSRASDLRAKRGAYKKGIVAVVKELSPAF